jgi:hypothetical protein
MVSAAVGSVSAAEPGAAGADAPATLQDEDASQDERKPERSAAPADPNAAQGEPVRVIDRDPSVFPPPRARLRLALVGIGATAATYGLSVGASYAWPDAPGADALRIPIAGPWLALADTGCPAEERNCEIVPVVFRAVLTGVAGVIQLGGLAVLGESLFLPTRDPVRDAEASRKGAGRVKGRRAATLRSWTLTPIVPADLGAGEKGWPEAGVRGMASATESPDSKSSAVGRNDFSRAHAARLQSGFWGLGISGRF